MKTDVISISEFSTIGIYTLLLHLSKEVTLIVGKLKKQCFQKDTTLTLDLPSEMEQQASSID
jgi:hypothetical protein